jgi:UMF1 family MFS transporter
MVSSPVTKDEIRGFYSFGVAAEGFSAMVVSVFFPLILQSLAAEQAFDANDHSVKCNPVGDYKCNVKLFGIYISTTSLVLYATSISVLIQFILFTTLGSLADYGPRRLQYMLSFGILTAMTGFCILFIVDSTLYLGAFLIYILSNTFFGASFVFLYSMVPVLTRGSPDVLAAAKDPNVSDEEYYHISDRVGNEISSKGFFYGYITAVVQLILSSAFVIYAEKMNNFGFGSVYPMQIAIAGVCLWEIFIICIFTSRLMKPRPGPPLPPGENYVSFSLKNRKFKVLT